MATASSGFFGDGCTSAITSSATAGSIFTRVMRVRRDQPISSWRSINLITRIPEAVEAQVGLLMPVDLANGTWIFKTGEYSTNTICFTTSLWYPIYPNAAMANLILKNNAFVACDCFEVGNTTNSNNGYDDSCKGVPDEPGKVTGDLGFKNESGYDFQLTSGSPLRARPPAPTWATPGTSWATRWVGHRRVPVRALKNKGPRGGGPNYARVRRIARR
jgi:hypothetical protein